MGILSRFLNKPPKSAPTAPSPVPEPVQAVEPQPVPQPEPEPQAAPEPPQTAVLTIPEPAPTAVAAPPTRSSSQSVVKKPQSNLGSRTPLDKVLQILELHDNGALPTHIAEQVSADRRTIGAIIRQYRDRPASAKQLLAQSAVMAAQAWQQAIPVAAARGNHGPAKELLLHVGAIDPAYGPGAARPTNVAVQVIIGTPDSPIADDPVAKAKPVK